MDFQISFLEIVLRLAAAVSVGLALGINRDLEGKPMGMRTLGLVGLSAATVTVGALHLPGFERDPAAASRVLQGIIQGMLTGIGFLGAGAVMRREPVGEIHGLTTAAIVLVVAVLGITCGLGAWAVAVVGAAFAGLLLIVLQPVERKLQKRSTHRRKGQPTPSDP